MSHHMAIMRHLARKMKLEGSTEAECAMVDMVMDQLQDYTGNITGLCYNQNFSQELLQQWVNATGSFSNSVSLKLKLESLERLVFRII